MDKEPITVIGLKNLKSELEDLKNVQRPKIVEAIAEARSHGDLKENAEYHAAREQQSFVEGRIKDIEAKLSNAQIIDIKNIPASSRVIFGTTVDLIDLSNNSKSKYKIVGEDEADLKENKLAVTSPLARCLIGKEEGDIVELKMPEKTIEYEIIKVKYV